MEGIQRFDTKAFAEINVVYFPFVACQPPIHGAAPVDPVIPLDVREGPLRVGMN
jgi:hypothetical protein